MPPGFFRLRYFLTPKITRNRIVSRVPSYCRILLSTTRTSEGNLTTFDTDALGSIWSAYPSSDRNGNINLLEGEDTVPALIISICIIAKGEIPLTPEFGLKPRLFGRVEKIDPEYWAEELAGEIRRWVPGVSGVRVETEADSQNGRVAAKIYYRTEDSIGSNSFVFPYHTYTGAVYYSDIPTFLSEIAQLNQFAFA